jgi:hypothetical protein
MGKPLSDDHELRLAQIMIASDAGQGSREAHDQ